MVAHQNVLSNVMPKNVKLAYGNVRFQLEYARPEIYVVTYVQTGNFAHRLEIYMAHTAGQELVASINIKLSCSKLGNIKLLIQLHNWSTASGSSNVCQV